MASKTCHVVRQDGRVVEILRNCTGSLVSCRGADHESRAKAVEEIRRAVFEKDHYRCRLCGTELSWDTGELDEILSKGRGGHVSVENGRVLCRDCHREKHAREPMFGESRIE